MSAGVPESPCILVCTIDKRTRLCLGCHRTIEEIARWSSLDDAAKRAILTRVEARTAPGG